jgi:hypothetical protein
MRIFLLMLLPIVLSFSVYGQGTEFYRFNRERYIKQSDYGRLRVVDLRTDVTDIGTVQKGMLNGRHKLVTYAPVEEIFSSYFKYMLPKDLKSDKELLLALYGFKIEDRPMESEMGTVYFSGDFYCDSNGAYALLGHVDTFIEVSAPVDVTYKLLQASQILVADLMEYYANSLAAKNATFRYSYEQIPNRRQTENDTKYPVYGAMRFKKGIYPSVDAFLSNQPIDTIFEIGKVSHTQSNPRYVFYYTQSNGMKGARIAPEDCFAIYDGEDWFLNQGSYWIGMKVSNGDFLATKRFDGIANNAAVVFMFGLVGALVTSGSTGKGEYVSVFDPEIKDFKRMQRVR